MSFTLVIKKLADLFHEANIDKGHGIEHATIVLNHAVNALETVTLPEHIKTRILLAALLHDSDDSKFFPLHTNNENTRKILQEVGYDEETIQHVIKMINLVSCSKNRNEPHEPSYELIPRWADRLEAIGEIGLIRSYIYARYRNMPLYTNQTPRAKTVEELFDISTNERFLQYKGVSESMIDHLYDKVLHLVNMGTDNVYLNAEAQRRHMEVVDFCLDFGVNGFIPQDVLDNWERTIL